MGAGGTFFIADFGFLGLKLVPAAAGEKKFSRKFLNFFFLKKSLQLKKLEIWVGGGGSKAISEGVGVILNARGSYFFF